jgi:hypothetical protein
MRRETTNIVRFEKFGGHCPSVPGIALRDLYPQPEEISTEARLPLQEEVELGTAGKRMKRMKRMKRQSPVFSGVRIKSWGFPSAWSCQ